MSKEAMKLALEALELTDAPLNNETVVLWEQKIDEAITALREALAEQPAQHPKAKAIAECLAVLRPAVKGKFPHEQALEELVGYIAAPQPAQQEPEGWNPSKNPMTAERAAYFMRRFKHEEKLLGPNEQSAVDYVIAMLERPAQQHARDAVTWTPETGYVFTQPAQRTWVGLTTADRKEIERQSVYVEGAIRLTEAKLKEKNT